MKNYFVAPEREGSRSEIYSYVNLGVDENGNLIRISCPRQFTFLEVTKEDNKLELITSKDIHGWIMMLSGQISCPPDSAEKIKVVAKGQKEIIGITTTVLLLSTKLENFFLRIKHQKGYPAHILQFFEYQTTIVTYGEADFLNLHNSTEYCNGDLIKL